MAFAPIPEYEGKSPYVFITYAQQDEKLAYSIAVKMYNEGFRIWSSAACGNPSNMRIAERLSNSEVAMIFLSKSYLKYASYNEFEPRVVMSSPKQKIVICLDDTPLGTDWNTVDFPAGIRYNPEIPQELWLKINSSDALEKCRGAWPKHPMPLPFEEITTINVSVNEDELSDELNSLNSVMSSFGAGLDDDDIKNITLFQKKDPNENKFEWQDKHENTQEQEYYAIENLIDTSPMPVPAEKKQYDNMIGLIENFMEKSNRIKEDELHKRMSEISSDTKQSAELPQVDDLHKDYVPVPLNEFESVDMTKDISNEPVVFTGSSDHSTTEANDGFTPIVIDYGDEIEHSNYSMTRNSGRSERFANTVMYPNDEGITDDTVEISPTAETANEIPEFEKIVDDRKLIVSNEDNVYDARLTYHLGGALSGFDEKNYKKQENSAPVDSAQPQSDYEPVDRTPVRFTDNDEIPQPTLSFVKPEQREKTSDIYTNDKSVQKVSPKSRKRCIVSVRTRIRHIEYENEMYKVNGRWIPGEIYHTKMPNAKYTMVKNMVRPAQPEPVSQSTNNNYSSSKKSRLNSNSRLFNAVNTFFAPPKQPQKSSEIPETLRSAMRQRHESRISTAIQQTEAEPTYPQYTEPALKDSSSYDDESTPARKHKFSHEAGIKKSLILPMESPIDADTEESHRQYGAKSETFASNELKKSEKKKNKKKKSEKSVSNQDEDALIAIPVYGKQPKINYDPSAYSDMNLSEILFGDKEKPAKKKKKK